MPLQTPRSVYNTLLAAADEQDDAPLIDVYRELRDTYGLLKHADKVTFQTVLQWIQRKTWGDPTVQRALFREVLQDRQVQDGPKGAPSTLENTAAPSA